MNVPETFAIRYPFCLQLRRPYRMTFRKPCLRDTSRIVASEPAQDALPQTGTASPRSGDIFAFKCIRFRLERHQIVGWAPRDHFKQAQVIEDPFECANHLISY